MTSSYGMRVESVALEMIAFVKKIELGCLNQRNSSSNLARYCHLWDLE